MFVSPTPKKKKCILEFFDSESEGENFGMFDSDSDSETNEVCGFTIFFTVGLGVTRLFDLPSTATAECIAIKAGYAASSYRKLSFFTVNGQCLSTPENNFKLVELCPSNSFREGPVKFNVIMK